MYPSLANIELIIALASFILKALLYTAGDDVLWLVPFMLRLAFIFSKFCLLSDSTLPKQLLLAPGESFLKLLLTLVFREILG